MRKFFGQQPGTYRFAFNRSHLFGDLCRMISDNGSVTLRKAVIKMDLVRKKKFLHATERERSRCN